MPHSYFVSSFLLLLLSVKKQSCHQKCNTPSGRYLNSTVLKSCPDKMPYDVPNYVMN
jgi:hypothetical protein